MISEHKENIGDKQKHVRFIHFVYYLCVNLLDRETCLRSFPVYHSCILSYIVSILSFRAWLLSHCACILSYRALILSYRLYCKRCAYHTNTIGYKSDIWHILELWKECKRLILPRWFWITRGPQSQSLEYQRLYTDFLSEEHIFAYQQPHYNNEQKSTIV